MTDDDRQPGGPIALTYVEPTTTRTTERAERSVLSEVGARMLWAVAGGAALFAAYMVLTTVLGIGWAVIMVVVGPLLLLALAMLAGNVTRLRGRRVDALLGQVGLAVRLGLPIPNLLRAAAKGEGRARRQQLQDAAESIAAGMPLGYALRRAAPHLSADTAARLDIAERNGTLAPTLARIDRTAEPEATLGPNPGMLLVYATLITIFAFIVTATIMIFVMPKFEEIFADFEMELPAVTASLLAVSRWIGAQYGWVLVLPLLLVLPWVVGQLLRELRLDEPRRALVMPMVRWVGWRLPLVGRAWRARQWAAVLDGTADGLELGRGVEEALTTSAAADLAGPLRERVLGLAGNLRQGQPWTQAATNAGLDHRTAQFLGVAARTNSLAPTCRFLARHHAATHSRLTALLSALATPAVTLLLAAVVGWIVLALFTPTIVLAESIMEQGWTP
ncbi:MAG: type II secretion system F family protein [Planctomycetota bacterium]